MGTFMNLLRGTVTVRAEGPFPERLINLCARERVDFWGVEWLEDGAVRMTTHLVCVRRLEELGRRVGCRVERERRRGLPWFLARFRRRYAFLLGLGLSLTAVFFLSRFILVVEVQGCEQVPKAVVLEQLRRQGLRPGAYGPGLDRNALAQEAMGQLDGLAWMGINISGTRAVVQVREAVPAPEMEDESGFYHITAETDGVILGLSPQRGDPAVEKGTVVAAGDVLISGVVSVEPPRYSQAPVYYFTTHAKGKVWARTWRTLCAETPLELTVKAYTGRERTRWCLEVFGWELPLHWGRGEPFACGDMEKVSRTLTLPGAGSLPAALTARIWREYAEDKVSADLAGAQSMLEERLRRELEALVGENGQILSRQYSARVSEGVLRVTVTAECVEEIGRETPAPDSDLPPAEVTLPK